MQIKQEVMVVLSELAFDGRNVRIEKALDRKLYVDVDKVLQACGGKWNRSAKAHIFAEEAAPIVDAAIVKGEVTTKRDIGFFPTPPPLALRLVEEVGVKLGHRCLEPSAGTGNIVSQLVDHGGIVEMVERDEKMRSDLKCRFTGVLDHDDFMSMPVRRYDRIVMNPPFYKVGLGDHIDHTKRAFEMLNASGCMASVLPQGIVFRQDKRHTAFREWVAERGRTIQLPEGSFKASGTMVGTVYVVLAS